ncbi:MAG: hypothetical protein HFI09_03625 [Bacilli bacterium]|nr:hypothetical protein [Bacilli bacterium]
MDFLTNLYSNDNFGIILFIVISILVLAFLIVLFFGKKDQKERKLAETKSIEVNNTLAQKAFTDDEPTVQLNIDPEIFKRSTETSTENELNVEKMVDPLPAPIVEEKSVPAPTLTDNDSIIKVENVQKEEEQIVPPKMDFDFDALADSISKELESISNQEESSFTITPPIVSEESVANESTFDTVETTDFPPIIEDSVSFNKVKEPIENNNYNNQEKPKMPSPNQFSSVFVSKKKENESKEFEVEPKPIIEEKKEPVIPPISPAKPNIELPKTIDLPKLNTNTEVNKKSDIVFSSLENDVSSYNRNDENRM